jgi:hypothetical protein
MVLQDHQIPQGLARMAEMAALQLNTPTQIAGAWLTGQRPLSKGSILRRSDVEGHPRDPLSPQMSSMSKGPMARLRAAPRRSISLTVPKAAANKSAAWQASALYAASPHGETHAMEAVSDGGSRLHQHMAGAAGARVGAGSPTAKAGNRSKLRPVSADPDAPAPLYASMGPPHLQLLQAAEAAVQRTGQQLLQKPSASSGLDPESLSLLLAGSSLVPAAGAAAAPAAAPAVCVLRPGSAPGEGAYTLPPRYPTAAPTYGGPAARISGGQVQLAHPPSPLGPHASHPASPSMREARSHSSSSSMLHKLPVHPSSPILGSHPRSPLLNGPAGHRAHAGSRERDKDSSDHDTGSNRHSAASQSGTLTNLARSLRASIELRASIDRGRHGMAPSSGGANGGRYSLTGSATQAGAMTTSLGEVLERVLAESAAAATLNSQAGRRRRSSQGVQLH